MSTITVSGLRFSYRGRPVLTDVSFSVSGGEVLCVLGPNGVGKSTLFRCMLGLLPGYEGEIEIDGRSIRTMDARTLAKHVAYVPQSHAPVFGYTVLDLVLMGASVRAGALRGPGAPERKTAMEMLERVGIADLAGRDYTKISGGERQLAFIARALNQQAEILVMDEPTANLDYGNQLRILEQIRLLAENGYSVILSTHHPEQAFLYAGQMLALLGGKVLRCGAPERELDSSLIYELYGVRADIEILREGRIRVCVPRTVRRLPADHN